MGYYEGEDEVSRLGLSSLAEKDWTF